MLEKDNNNLEKIILAGVGAITKTAESAGELLEELVKKGELSFEQGKAINEELKHGIKEHIEEKKQAVQSSIVSGFIDKMDRLTAEELAKIREKIEELENIKIDGTENPNEESELKHE